MDLGMFNSEYDEYGDFLDLSQPHASYAISQNETIQTEIGYLPCARSYIQAPKGRGREAFNALEYMLQMRADRIGAFVHIACDMYFNDAVDHMCRKAGYEYEGQNNNQRYYKKIFKPQMYYAS